MSRITSLKEYLKSSPMELDQAMAEVYADLTSGMDDFAMLDGGANRGWHAYQMLQLPGCGQVYAVEADPSMSETLRTNLAKWHKKPTPAITVVAKALQNRADIQDIPWMSSHSHAGRSSIMAEGVGAASIWDGHKDVEYRPMVRVPATTIDLILKEEPRPVPFIKLDLEGADIIALMGAEQTLAAKRPMVAFENSNKAPEVHGYSLQDVSDYFGRHDYVPIDYVGDRLQPDTWFDFYEAWAIPAENFDQCHSLIQIAINKRLSAS